MCGNACIKIVLPGKLKVCNWDTNGTITQQGKQKVSEILTEQSSDKETTCPRY